MTIIKLAIVSFTAVFLSACIPAGWPLTGQNEHPKNNSNLVTECSPDINCKTGKPVGDWVAKAN